MYTPFSYYFGPIDTPKLLKWLIYTTVGCSLAAAIFDPLIAYFFESVGLEYLFGLSWNGLSHGFFWQFLTFPFFHDVPVSGLTLSFLISLAFNMYMLWVIGAELCDRMGISSFIYFYFGSAIVSGFAALIFASHYLIIVGPWGSLLALFTLWTMMGPDREILLFFLLPVRLKWLFGFILGALLLISLSHLDFVSFVLYFIAFTFGYLYGILKWQLSAPFSAFHPLDHLLYRFGDYAKTWRHKKQAISPTKIYDLRTGEPVLTDDEFVDAMLTKIAKHGEEALSWSEKKRLQAISAKRK